MTFYFVPCWITIKHTPLGDVFFLLFPSIDFSEKPKNIGVVQFPFLAHIHILVLFDWSPVDSGTRPRYAPTLPQGTLQPSRFLYRTGCHMYFFFEMKMAGREKWRQHDFRISPCFFCFAMRCFHLKKCSWISTCLENLQEFTAINSDHAFFMAKFNDDIFFDTTRTSLSSCFFVNELLILLTMSTTTCHECFLNILSSNLFETQKCASLWTTNNGIKKTCADLFFDLFFICLRWSRIISKKIQQHRSWCLSPGCQGSLCLYVASFAYLGSSTTKKCLQLVGTGHVPDECVT